MTDSTQIAMRDVPQPGHFYAVGVGPGAPDLLTLRAARLIECCDVIIAPQSEKATTSLALDTVQAHIQSQKVVSAVYPMVRDEVLVAERWDAIAEQAAGYCSAGYSVVQITIGDPLIFSTSIYLMTALAERMPQDKIHAVPGISAFQASAALLNQPLTLQEDRMALMPATDLAAVERALSQCETLVLYKVAGRVDQIAVLLTTHDLMDVASLVMYAEIEGREQVVHSLQDAVGKSLGYMALIIVRPGHKKWSAVNDATQNA